MRLKPSFQTEKCTNPNLSYNIFFRLKRAAKRNRRLFFSRKTNIGELPRQITKFDLKRAFGQYQPTAIIVGIDEDCRDVMDTLRELGLRVPEDCSLLALLNEPLGDYPAISRPVFMIKETGCQAADKMLWRICTSERADEHTGIIGNFFEGGRRPLIVNM